MSQEGEREKKNETIISTLSELSPRRDNFRVILQHRSQTYTGLATITYTKRQPKLLIRSWRTRIVSYCFTITKKKKVELRPTPPGTEGARAAFHLDK